MLTRRWMLAPRRKLRPSGLFAAGCDRQHCLLPQILPAPRPSEIQRLRLRFQHSGFRVGGFLRDILRFFLTCKDSLGKIVQMPLLRFFPLVLL